MLATSLLRKTEFPTFLEISTSFALLLVQSAKDNPPWHLQDYITSARVTPMPVFSKNIVVPTHHSPDKEPYNTLRERRKEKLSLWTTASALYNKEYQGLATEFAGPSAK